MLQTYLTNGKQLSFEKPIVMAIINVTPDSFFDGGKYKSIKDIMSDASEKITNGAAILDLGAVSTRPGSLSISTHDEVERLHEPLLNLRKEFPEILISIDTADPVVAKFCVENGADIINHVCSDDSGDEMLQTVAALNVPYILMHMQGTPLTMQNNPVYKNIINEIESFFWNKIESAAAINFNKIILDPGFGFGKTTEYNYRLLKGLSNFKKFGFPLLAGISRKGMITKVIDTIPQTALTGTIVLNTIALINGASILRVHDVKEAVQTVELLKYYVSV